MAQLILELSRGTALGRADFFVSGGNRGAADWIDRWPAWPSPALVVHGPPGCGKTHLAHLWCERASAILVPGASLDEARLRQLLDGSEYRVAVDDADRADEAALLHLFNACREGSGSLLLTARVSPGTWSVALPDLGSRLRAALAVGIGLPDDLLLGAVLAKHFADRQVLVAAEVIAYLVRHMERSLAAAVEIAAALDAQAISIGGAITVPLARRILAERADQPFAPDPFSPDPSPDKDAAAT
jgi:chromosomal replication initiation ATPase DnaA